MNKTLSRLLRKGRIDTALDAAHRSLAKYPHDDDVLDVFLSFHLSLARQQMVGEDFTTAERALQTILAADARHPEAHRLLQAIVSAREKAPRRVDIAEKWIAVEWFEPAFNTLRQAVALRPDQRKAWARIYYEAALGAGDDDYFTKNFHAAFFAYDAAIRLAIELGMQPADSLISRWLQSLAHALADDIKQVRYPPEYWNAILQRAATVASQWESGAAILALLRGLAYENVQKPVKAAREYDGLLGRPLSRNGAGNGNLAQSRAAALRLLRQWYDMRLSNRRKGIWQQSEAGDWQVLETDRFRIHHRNGTIAQRVADALDFHFIRIAALMALDPTVIPWSLPSDVYLHSDGSAFRDATAQPEQVRAISLIQQRGTTLHRHIIHVYQTDSMLLSASLSHELAHLMIAAATQYMPGTAVLNEGMALHLEPASRNRQFARLFSRLAKPRSIAGLLDVGSLHPPESDFYVEAYRLTSILLDHGDLSMALQIETQHPDRRKLARRFGFGSGKALEKAYRGSSGP